MTSWTITSVLIDHSSNAIIPLGHGIFRAVGSPTFHYREIGALEAASLCAFGRGGFTPRLTGSGSRRCTAFAALSGNSSKIEVTGRVSTAFAICEGLVDSVRDTGFLLSIGFETFLTFDSTSGFAVSDSASGFSMCGRRGAKCSSWGKSTVFIVVRTRTGAVRHCEGEFHEWWASIIS